MSGADVYDSATGVATIDTIGGGTDSSRTAGTYTISESDYTTDVSGGGSGASFSVVINGSGAAAVSVTSPGDGWAVDESITVPSEKIGAAAGDTALTFDVATLTSGAKGFRRAVNKVTGPVVTPATSTNTVVMTESNRSALHPMALYFVVETDPLNPIIYKCAEAVTNEVSVDFDVEGIATLNWSGMAKEIQDVSGNMRTGTGTTLASGAKRTLDGSDTGVNVAAGDLYFQTNNAQGTAVHLVNSTPSGGANLTQAIDEAITSTNTFIII
jgi:hypothetical protein